MSKPRQIREWSASRLIDMLYRDSEEYAAELAFYSRVTVELKKEIQRIENMMLNLGDYSYTDGRIAYVLREVLERAEKET